MVMEMNIGTEESPHMYAFLSEQLPIPQKDSLHKVKCDALKRVAGSINSPDSVRGSPSLPPEYPPLRVQT